MSETTINRLAWLEMDFARIDTALGDVFFALYQSTGEVPECEAAAHDITRLRYALRSVLKSIDEPLSDAIAQQTPPPF